jgi:hypothetical protein
MLERWDGETADPDVSGCGRTRSSSCVCLVSVVSAPEEDGADHRLRVGERC